MPPSQRNTCEFSLPLDDTHSFMTQGTATDIEHSASSSSPRLSSFRHNQTPIIRPPPPSLQPAHLKRCSTGAPVNHTSPSIKLALADTFLTQSIKDSIGKRGGLRTEKRKQEESERNAKKEYERAVRRYYYQLTIGCGRAECTNKLCSSCTSGPRFAPEAASVMAIQLASRPRHFFCSSCPPDPAIGEFLPSSSSVSLPTESPLSSSSTSAKEAKSFLYSLFTASTFASIFSVTPNDEEAQKDKDESLAMPPSQPAPKSKRSSTTSKTPMIPTTPTVPSSSNAHHLQRTPSKRPTNPLPPPSMPAGPRNPPRRSNSFQRAATTPPISLSRKDSASSIRPSDIAPARSPIAPCPTEEPSISERLPRKARLTGLPGFLATGLRRAVRGESVDVVTSSSLLHGNRSEPTRRSNDAEEETEESHRRRRASTSSTTSSPSAADETDDTCFVYTTKSGSTAAIQSSLTDSLAGIDSLSLGTLSLDLVKRAIATYTTGAAHDERDPRFLANTIKRVMSDWEGLGRSFLVTEGNGAGRLLDLAQVREGYRILLGLEPGCMFEAAVSNSLELLLVAMEANMEGFLMGLLGKEPEMIVEDWTRSLMCMIECPVVVREESRKDGKPYWFYDRGLLKRTVAIMGAIGRLHDDDLVRRQMVGMLAGWDNEGLGRFVGVLQAFLVETWHPHPVKAKDRIVDLIETLRLCYDANRVRQLISCSTFYNDELTKRMNLKEEYRIWKRLQLNGVVQRPTQSSHDMLPSFSTSAFSSNAPHPTSTFTYISAPFLFDPSTKARILRIDAMQQMSEEYEDACVNHTLVMHAQRLLAESPRMVRDLERNLRNATNPYLVLEVRREKLVEDAMEEIGRRWCDRRKPLKVRFVGSGEDGMDQGGVQKEFLGLLMSSLMEPSRGLFVRDDEGDKTRLAWFADSVVQDPLEDFEALYEFCGVVMGLAVYNGIMLNVAFPSVLWRILICESDLRSDCLAETFGLEDIELGWPTLARGLRQMLEWPESEGDVYDVFLRSFEISFNVLGEVTTIELIPGGANVPVTNTNREDYIHRYCRHFMYLWVRRRLLAMRRGFWSVASGMGLRMLSWEELEMVICGRRGTTLDGKVETDDDDEMLDLTELEEAAGYDDGYDATHYVIRNFWSVVHNLRASKKRQLLLFVTASDRIPIGGLKDLTFIIQRNGPDSDRLPTALTCFSRLLLPEYSNLLKLEERLVTAIGNAKGFGLV